MISSGAGSKCCRIVIFKVSRDITVHVVPLLIQQGSPGLLFQPPLLTPLLLLLCPSLLPQASSPTPRGQAQLASGQLSVVLIYVVPKLA